MKLKTFTFLKHKTYLFSFIVLILGSILFALPAYSQVDYYYGLNKKGFRVDIGAGVAVLNSNWSTNSPGAAGIVALDYDFDPYFSIGIEGQFGALKGQDTKGKLYYYQTNVTYFNTDVNFKVAVGQFADFKTTKPWQDIIKRIYIGAGVGSIYSEAQLKNHYDGKGLLTIQDGAVVKGAKPLSNGDLKGNNTYSSVPLNFGTNIALRGFLGSDRVELNPNFQYTLVMSPVFDGYEPSKVDNPSISEKKSGDQAYWVGSLTLRFKF